MNYTIIFDHNKQIILNEYQIEFFETIKSLISFENVTDMRKSRIFTDLDNVYNIIKSIFVFELDNYVSHKDLILKIFDFFMIDIELLIPNKKLYNLIEDDSKYKKDTMIQINRKKDISFAYTKDLIFLLKNNKYILFECNNKFISLGNISELEIQNSSNYYRNEHIFEYNLKITNNNTKHITLIKIIKNNKIFCFDDKGNNILIGTDDCLRTLVYPNNNFHISKLDDSLRDMDGNIIYSQYINNNADQQEKYTWLGYLFALNSHYNDLMYFLKEDGMIIEASQNSIKKYRPYDNKNLEMTFDNKNITYREITVSEHHDKIYIYNYKVYNDIRSIINTVKNI